MKNVALPDLDKRTRNLFQSGKLVQVHVSKWSMMVGADTKDLGIEEKDSKIPAFVTIGKKALFTDEVRLVFSRIESAARAYLIHNSHQYPIADAHFVPTKLLEKVSIELDKYRAEFFKQVDNLITNYEVYKQQMLDKYPDYEDNLLPCYLPISEVRSRYNFSISLYEVAFPKKMDKVTRTEIIAQNLAAEKASAKYEALMKEQYQHHLTQMESFLKESTLALRGEIVKTFEVMAQKIQNREVISGANLKTMKAAIDSFDALDFLDDQKVKQNLAIVKKLISSGADFKSDAEIVQRLNTAINTTLETAKSISDIDTLTGEYTRRLDFDEL
jgi:hypothetical protein